MPCRIYARSLRSTRKTALIRHKHGKVYDQLSATQNNHLDDYDTWTDIRTLSQTLRYKNCCLRSGEMQYSLFESTAEKGCQIPCHVIRMTKTASRGIKSIWAWPVHFFVEREIKDFINLGKRWLIVHVHPLQN